MLRVSLGPSGFAFSSSRECRGDRGRLQSPAKVWRQVEVRRWSCAAIAGPICGFPADLAAEMFTFAAPTAAAKVDSLDARLLAIEVATLRWRHNPIPTKQYQSDSRIPDRAFDADN